MCRGITKFRTSKSTQNKLSLILCASLIINMLFGSIAMAAAATGGHHSHGHHSENVHTAHHQEQHHQEQHHGKLHHNALHKIDLPENNHNAGDKPHSGHSNASHDCCKMNMTNGCTNMAACAAHCAQPLPTLWQQPHSIFCLSLRLDAIAPGSLASIDPSRQFKPPRS